MKRLVIAIIFPMALLVQGCHLYKPYSRPELDVDTDLLFAPRGERGDSSIATIKWEEFFSDRQLVELIGECLERNTDLRSAMLTVEEARARLGAAKLSFLPSAGLDLSAGSSHFNGVTKNTYSLGGSASWEIEIFGKLTNTKRAAAAALEQDEAYVQAVRASLVATVADCYYTLLMLDEQLAISEQTTENWTETIRMLGALSKAGRSNEVAVEQATANLAGLRANMATIRQSIVSTESSLCSLLKEPYHSIGRGNLESQQFPERLTTGLPLALLANRPDVRKAEWAMAEAYYTTNVARAAFYPSLNLSGALGWTNSSGGTIVNPGKLLSSALASLTAPLFNKGVNRANLKIAEAQQEKALLAFEQALIDAGLEVNLALAQWQTSNDRITYDLEQVEKLESAVEKTRLLVRYTSSNYLEVLTAQNSLLDARLTLAKDRLAKIQSVIELYHALGGGGE